MGDNRQPPSMKEKDAECGGIGNPAFVSADDDMPSEVKLPVTSSSADLVSADEPEVDPWALLEPKQTGKPWHEKNCGEKFKTVLKVSLKVMTLLSLLYLFICSLDFLSSAFRLLGGKAASQAFTENIILNNPIGLLMLGVLATVLLQSSSTTTSIVVSMVNSDILQVRPAIFIIMGANIGTSVTNTIVAMFQSVDRNEFRRAFAGATVHDMFNWLSVLILLPIEWASGSGAWHGCGLLCQMTGAITKNLEMDPKKAAKQELLKTITKPFTSLIVQIDKNVLKNLAMNKDTGESLIKHSCKFFGPRPIAQANNITGQCEIIWKPMEYKDKCVFMFESISSAEHPQQWSDAAVGGCLLVISIGILCCCLVCIVKLLHSLLQGQFAKLIRKFLNAKFPGCASHFTGYVAILMGAGMTMLVQSSSIFTSAITPLVGVGVLHLKRMYPLTLGANIGTTMTAILAALASDRDHLQVTLQVALCHLFFNIIGILIWYPVPFMRKVPIQLAKKLGNTTAKYRWFAIMYLFLIFFIVPASVFGLSVAGWPVLLGVGGPLFLFFGTVIIINILQHKAPRALPNKLRNWNFLPLFMHSLQPLDNFFMRFRCCRKKKKEVPLETVDTSL